MTGIEIRRLAYDAIRERPNGITRRALQRQLGITDPTLEENRSRVWQLAAALAGLIRDRFIVTATEHGEVRLYPQMA